MIIYQKLGDIYDNPYQVRRVYDRQAIQDLADSISHMRESRPETRGLIQVPPARLHPTDPRVVQLAAGHSRLRAFRLLASAGDGADDPDAWGQMPVDLVALDDRAMSDVIWHENAKRRDLSSIEEAHALRRAIDQFGYTQAALGERWGLSQSAVANKLRLLDLPADAQDAIAGGVLTERHGRALLSAQSKSPELYRRMAAELLPTPEPAAEIVDKARAATRAGSGFGWTSVPRAGVHCVACGQAVEPNESNSARGRYDHVTSKWLYLCEPCHRAAKGWTPPTAAVADSRVDDIAGAIGKRMAEAVWPLELAVGQGEPGVRSALCETCPALHQRDSGTNLCLDAGCYDAKGRGWTAHMVAQLEAALAGDGHPVRINPTPGYSNQDLSPYYPSHVAIAAAGRCRACEHSQFHYVPVRDGDRSLRPIEGLPWVWSCSSPRSLKACVAQAERDAKTPGVLAAEQAAADAQRRRAAQGKALADAAAAQIARALADGVLETWRAVALAVDYHGADRIKKLATTDEIQHYLGRHIANQARLFPTWEQSDSVSRYAEGLDRLGSRLGVSLVSPARRISGHLDRMERWIDKPAARNPKALEGNRRNLDEYLREATLAAGKQELDRGEYDELAERIAALDARLEAISQEMIPPLVERAKLLEAA